MSGTVRIAILANAAQAKAEIASVGESSSKLGGILKTGIVGGAALAGAALAKMTFDSIAGARESAQIHRTLESQIAGLGGAAKTAFGGATTFAEQYGQQIAQDDDDILKVINKLSTFPDAFKKGSLGAQAMERATKAAFDLQATGIGSAESSIIGIGKALNDPIKGMTALSDSGVTFTEEQAKQIKNFMKQGDLAGAQEVLLKGIESNAKNAATAQADGLDRAKVALAGFGESLAGAVLPYLDKFGAWFTDTGLPAISAFADWFGTNVGPKIGEAFTMATQAGQTLFDLLGNPVVQAFAASIGAIVLSLQAYSGVMAVVRGATAAWAAVQAALNVVLTANPIGLVVLAVVGLAAGIAVAYRQSETFRQIVQTGWAAIKAAVSAVVDWFVANVPKLWAVAQQVWSAISTAASVAWSVIRAYISGVFAVITGVFNVYRAVAVGVWNVISTAAGTAWGAISTVVKTVVDKVTGFVTGLRDGISNLFTGAGTMLRDAGVRIITGLWDGLKQKWEDVKAWFSNITNMIPDLKGPAARDAKLLTGNGQLVMDGFLAGLESRYRDVRSSLAQFTGSLSGSAGAGGLVGRAGAVLDAASANGTTTGSTVVNLTVQGAIDPVSTGRQIVDAIRQYSALNGAVFANA